MKSQLHIDTFLADLHKRENTKTAYRQTLNLFERFLDGKKPTENEARAFIRHLIDSGLKETSVARHGYALRHYFKWMRKPIFLEIPTAIRRLLPWLDKKDIDRILKATQTPLEKAMVMLLYDTAIRIGELRSLQLGDVDWERGFLFVKRKGGREGWTPIGSVTLDALREYLHWRQDKTKLLFPFSYHQLRHWLLQLSERAGYEGLTFHAFRHARAAILREDEVPLENIRDLLGHANIQTTLIYAQIKPERLKQVLPPAFGGGKRGQKTS